MTGRTRAARTERTVAVGGLPRLLVVALALMGLGLLLLVVGVALQVWWLIAVAACCFVVAAVNGARAAGRAQRERDGGGS